MCWLKRIVLLMELVLIIVQLLGCGSFLFLRDGEIISFYYDYCRAADDGAKVWILRNAERKCSGSRQVDDECLRGF